METPNKWHRDCCNSIDLNDMKINPTGSKKHEHAYSLVEVMVAAILTAVFFASLFELNAMCLRFIDSSKESLAALQGVQDRLEALRNRNFVDLTRTDCSPCVPVPPATTCVTTPCVQTLMATAANQSPFLKYPSVQEVVTISDYPAGLTRTYTRDYAGTVTAATSGAATIPGAQMAKVDVSISWTTKVGGRARTEQTSCIVANGSKK